MNQPRMPILILILTSVGAALLLLVFWFIPIESNSHLPQVTVTLIGLTGASWFVAYRLFLLKKGIIQQQEATFYSAIKDAVEMISTDTSVSLAGQQWLHGLSGDTTLPNAPLLVQSLLCGHIENLQDKLDCPSSIKSCQFALNLLFGDRHRLSFKDCLDIPDLSGKQWWNLNFTSLNLRKAILSDCDFTSTTLDGTQFDYCDLRNTKWTDIGGDSRTSARVVKAGGTKISSGKVFNVDFSQADFSARGRNKSEFKFVTFLECDFTATNFSRSSFTQCSFIKCIFKDTVLDGVEFSRPYINHCFNISIEGFSRVAFIEDPQEVPPALLVALRELGLVVNSSES